MLVPVLIAGCGESGRGLAPIRVEALVTLGASSGDGAIATTPVVSALHPDGFRIVIPAHSAIGTLPLVFTELGNYRESLDGDGTPAGSFDGAMFTRFGARDSVWVFDNSGRVLIFTPQLRYVRSVTLAAAPTDAIVLPDGRMLALSAPATVQVLDTAGAVVRVIAVAPPSGTATQLLIPGMNGTFWTSAIAGNWQLQHWDTSGTRLGGLTAQPDWLVAGGSGAAAPESAPKLVALWFDEGGRIWMVAQVADRGHHEESGATSTSQALSDDDKNYDSVVEVRDGKSGAVIATTRFDKCFLSSAGAGIMVHVVRTSAGWQQAELFRIAWDAATSR